MISLKWRTIAIISIFLFVFLLRFWNLNQMGRTWDESWHANQGYRYTEALKRVDFNDPVWYKDPDNPPFAEYLYGVAAHFDISSYENNKPIYNYNLTYSRIVSVIFASLTAVIILLLGWRYLSPFVGISAAVIFGMLPNFVGLSQLVTLESPLVFFFTYSVYLFFGLLHKITLKSTIITGIVAGLTISIKLSNILLFLVLIGLYYFLYKSRNNDDRKKLLDPKLLLIFPIAFVVFVLLWPSLLFHLEEVLRYNIAYRGSQAIEPIHETFFGFFMGVPIPYFGVYFLITTPFVVLMLFFIGLKKISDEKRWILYGLVWWFVFPFIQSFYNYRQNGIRYVIEIYTPLSLIAAIGLNYLIEKLTKNVAVKLLYFIPIVIYLFIVLFYISPYYLNYYNVIVGGTKNVYEKKLFPIGWWGDGLREAGDYLEAHAENGATVGLWLNPMHTMYQPANLIFSPYHYNKRYDYVVVNEYGITRAFYNERELMVNYKPVHFINGDGAVLVKIYKHK